MIFNAPKVKMVKKCFDSSLELNIKIPKTTFLEQAYIL
jgi:hypothetical protein